MKKEAKEKEATKKKVAEKEAEEDDVFKRMVRRHHERVHAQMPEFWRSQQNVPQHFQGIIAGQGAMIGGHVPITPAGMGINYTLSTGGTASTAYNAAQLMTTAGPHALTGVAHG